MRMTPEEAGAALERARQDYGETLRASSMASSDQTEDMMRFPPKSTGETLKSDTENSEPRAWVGQPVDVNLPYEEGDVKEAMGYDRDDPNVSVRFVANDNPVDTDTMDDEDALLSETIAGLLDEVWAEVLRAIEKHPTPHASPHESYAIIKEELDELWAEIMADRGRQASARKEAVQIAAMAVRFLLDVDPS